MSKTAHTLAAAGFALAVAFPAAAQDASIQHVKDLIAQARAQQVEVPKERCFFGFDAYQRLLASGVDVVLITPASHFIPTMLKDAVAAGKHVFCEKPHGIDIPGLKSSMAASQQAQQKGLSLVSGLCWRYHHGVKETMKRVLDGAIGQILAIHLAQPLQDGSPGIPVRRVAPAFPQRLHGAGEPLERQAQPGPEDGHRHRRSQGIRAALERGPVQHGEEFPLVEHHALEARGTPWKGRHRSEGHHLAQAGHGQQDPPSGGPGAEEEDGLRHRPPGA